MKTVQGAYRQYQLVDKTKRKDLDGVVYLIAGERDLWVKLLKDHSEAKKNEVMAMIRCGASSGFEKPLEIVTDKKGFAGYTFRGKIMDVVPVKEKPNSSRPNPSSPNLGSPNLGRPNLGRPNPGSPNSSSSMEGSDKKINQQGRSCAGVSGGMQYLILAVTTLLMTALTFWVLDSWVIDLMYRKVSSSVGEGSALLSMRGIIPAVGGTVMMLSLRKVFGSRIDAVCPYIFFAILAFLLGIMATYVAIEVICVLVIRILGVVKAYQSVIVMVI